MDSDEDDKCQYISGDSSDSEEGGYNLDVEILLSIIYRYPGGIGYATLLNKYSDIKKSMSDTRLVRIGPALVHLKGVLIDYKTLRDGLCIYSAMYQKVSPATIHPLISEIGQGSQILTVSLAKIIDCNCFIVYFQEDFEVATLFEESLQSHCTHNLNKLERVQPWQVNSGDCFVYFCGKFKSWIRIKVINCNEDGKTAVCAAVDWGDFYKCKISDLRVAPELSDYSDTCWRTPKKFQQYSFVIRCCLDVSQKPFDGFPSSTVGLQFSLCGEKPLDETTLKIRFLSYDSGNDVFIVDILSQDGNRSILVEAVENNPGLLEIDAASLLNFTDEINF